ncbi:MAG: GNAT family N-acetyltransferase [bacterium]
MKIAKVGPLVPPDKMTEIASVYKEVFSREPWNEVWAIDQIVADFKKEMLKIGAVCYLAQEQKKIVGFTWGYNIYVDEKIDVYLDSPGLYDIIGPQKYLYIDEVAVLPEFQNKGIGKSLVTSMCGDNNSLPVLLRTKDNSPAHKMFLGLGGKVVLNISRERVIMIIDP